MDFQDQDEELDLEQRVMRISMTINEMKQRAAEVMSNSESIREVRNIEDSMKRESEYELHDTPKKKKKMEDEHDYEADDSCPQKTRYRELCLSFEAKETEAQQLREEIQQLADKTEEMELRCLKEKVATRRLIQNHMFELLKWQKLQALENANSYTNGRKTAQDDANAEYLREFITDIKSKKPRRGRTSKNNPQDPCPLESYEKDKILFVNEISKKMEAQLAQLDKDRLRKRSQNEANEKFTKNQTYLRSFDVEQELIQQRYLVRKWLQTSSKAEYYDCFDLQTLENVVVALWPAEASKKQHLKHIVMLEAPGLVKNISYGSVNDCLFVARQAEQGITLLQHLTKYQSLTESATKYVIRKTAIALCNLKSKAAIQEVASASRIIIVRSRSDIKLLFAGQSLYNIKSGAIHEETFQDYVYYSPQCFRNGTVDNISTWSLGILLYISLFGRKPFKYDREELRNYQFHEELEFPQKPSISEAAKQLMRQCLSVKTRIGLQEVLKHEYFLIK